MIGNEMITLTTPAEVRKHILSLSPVQPETTAEFEEYLRRSKVEREEAIQEMEMDAYRSVGIGSKTALLLTADWREALHIHGVDMTINQFNFVIAKNTGPKC